MTNAKLIHLFDRESPKGGATIAFERKTGKLAVALCSAKEQFSRKEGRGFALDRLKGDAVPKLDDGGHEFPSVLIDSGLPENAGGRQIIDAAIPVLKAAATKARNGRVLELVGRLQLIAGLNCLQRAGCETVNIGGFNLALR